MEDGYLEAGTAEGSCVSDVVEPDLEVLGSYSSGVWELFWLVLRSKLLTRHVGHAHALLWLKTQGLVQDD